MDKKNIILNKILNFLKSTKDWYIEKGKYSFLFEDDEDGYFYKKLLGYKITLDMSKHGRKQPIFIKVTKQFDIDYDEDITILMIGDKKYIGYDIIDNIYDFVSDTFEQYDNGEEDFIANNNFAPMINNEIKEHYINKKIKISSFNDFLKFS